MTMVYFFRVFVQDKTDCDNDQDDWVSFDSDYVGVEFGLRDQGILQDKDQESVARSEFQKIAIHKRFRAVVHENVDDNTLRTLFFLQEQELIAAIDIELYEYDNKQGKDAAILLSSMTFNAKIIRHSIDFNDNYEFRFQIVGSVGVSDAPDISVALRMAEKEAQFAGTKDSATRNEIIDKYSGSLSFFSTRAARRASSVRVRFSVEVALATLSAFLGVLTLFTDDWIEALTGFDPDKNNGSVEWMIAAALFLAGILSSIAARTDWRRLSAAELAAKI